MKKQNKIDWFRLLVLLFAILMVILTSSCSVTKFHELDTVWHQSISKGGHYTTSGRQNGQFTDDGKVIEYQFCFQNSYYNHGDNDQYDWNKALMLKANFFKPHDLTTGNGWRVNAEDSTIQINFYHHGIVAGQFDYFKIQNGAWFTNDTSGYITIPVNGCFNSTYIIDESRMFIENRLENPYTGRVITDFVQLKRPFPNNFFLVNPYFGGNRVAPNKFKFMIFWNKTAGIQLGEQKQFLFFKWREVKKN